MFADLGGLNFDFISQFLDLLLRLKFISVRIIQLLLFLQQIAFESVNLPDCLIQLGLGATTSLRLLLALLDLLHVSVVCLLEAFKLS